MNANAKWLNPGYRPRITTSAPSSVANRILAAMECDAGLFCGLDSLRQDNLLVELPDIDRAYVEIFEGRGVVLIEHADHPEWLDGEKERLRICPVTFRTIESNSPEQVEENLKHALLDYLRNIIRSRESTDHWLFTCWRWRPEIRPGQDIGTWIGYARFCAQWADKKFAPQAREVTFDGAKEHMKKVEFDANPLETRTFIGNPLPPMHFNEAADLNEENILRAIKDIEQIKRDRGVKMGNHPTQWHFTTTAARAEGVSGAKFDCMLPTGERFAQNDECLTVVGAMLFCRTESGKVYIRRTEAGGNWLDPNPTSAEMAAYFDKRKLYFNTLRKNASQYETDDLNGYESQDAWDEAANEANSRRERDESLMVAMQTPIDFNLRQTPPEAMLLPDSPHPAHNPKRARTR